MGFLSGTCPQCRRHRFHPWVRQIPWRGKQQPAPGFLPGESHGQRSLAGYSPRGHKESDTTEATTHACAHTLGHSVANKPQLSTEFLLGVVLLGMFWLLMITSTHSSVMPRPFLRPDGLWTSNTRRPRCIHLLM